MPSRAKPEIRSLGRSQFPRWVIIDDSKRPPAERVFWNGFGWVEELRDARLYNDMDAALRDRDVIQDGD